MKIEITNGVETPVTKFFSATPDALKDRDEWAAMCGRYKQERDVIQEKYRFAVIHWQIGAAKMERERDEARGHCESIVDKAKELIARWDQPSWKDTAPTARFINALRIAVRAYEERLK